MDTQSQILQTPRGPILYQSHGEGPPLIMIHGFLGRPQDFRWILPGLIERFQVFLPELPGMVSTDLGAHDPLDQKGMACFVELFMDGLNIQSSGMVAHSMGAGVAVSFAANHPERVDALGLISPVGPRIHKALAGSKLELGHTLLTSPLRWLFMPLMRFSLRRMGFPRGVRDEAIVNSMWFNTLFDYDAYAKMLDSLSMPVFLTYTTNDSQIEQEIFEELQELVRPSVIKVYEKGGHNPQKHHSNDVVEGLLEVFLTQKQP
ncbi:MAG: hypothetical protein CMK59_06505 [Proteobacteria bacterium]|nr:hypothetical protein [Pseudomonadota bacterium]